MKGGKRELSLGYKVDLDETPGVWEGQPYDAIQRNIRVNHLAVVPQGRAGNARLNLDRYDAVSFNPKEPQMSLSSIKLDSGLSYEAAPEVIHELEKVRVEKNELTARADALQKQIDTVSGERDTLKAEVAKIEQIKADALEAAREEVKTRAGLEQVALAFKVDTAGKTNREVKELVIKSVRADADLEGKSNDYIDASYDMSVAIKHDAATAVQRAAGAPNGRVDAKPETANAKYKAMMNSLGKKD
jgi:hypothetical protein